MTADPMKPVRLIWRAAPAVGSAARIWCGVARGGQYCVVAGPEDRLRKCEIIGYHVVVDDRPEPELLVRVRMNASHPRVPREHSAHVSCLEAFSNTRKARP
jgi:hypothetical protein